MQTKFFSILEVSLNILSGILVSLLIQIIIFPLFDWNISLNTNIQLVILFSSFAFIRGLIFRRLFNKWTPLQKFNHSLIEVLINVFTGWLLAFTMQLIVFPMYGINATISEDIQISIIFTIAAVLRGLYFRRLFNKITK